MVLTTLLSSDFEECEIVGSDRRLHLTLVYFLNGCNTWTCTQKHIINLAYFVVAPGGINQCLEIICSVTAICPTGVPRSLPLLSTVRDGRAEMRHTLALLYEVLFVPATQ